jgi:glycosyltransferase involved in cell wall biosynthesis
MNVLLATYNFYPYNWGGSEVYVSGLAQLLHAQGKNTKLIAAVPDQAFELHGVWWSGAYLRVCQYEYEGIVVYGVTHALDTTDIYRKYRAEWESDWRDFFAQLETQEHWIPDLLHLHGFTAIIGLALVKAFRQKYATAPIHASYHTPISCPKGTLLRWEKEACSIRANTFDCSACTWQAKTDWPQWASSLAMQLLPKQLPDQAPTGLKWKALVGSAVEAFQGLQELVTKWWVFSEQIQKVLLAQGVAANDIQMGRHGIAPQFTGTAIQERQQSPLIFAFVGRFKTIKGLQTLLKAWLNLPNDPIRQLWLIGDPKDADTPIQILLTQLQLRQDVKIMGSQSAENLATLYAKIHALIVPSECVEIGPLVVHEAVARGANIIGSNIGGIRELASIYSNVFQLFNPGNANELADQILNFKYRSVSAPVQPEKEHYQKVVSWYRFHAQ